MGHGLLALRLSALLRSLHRRSPALLLSLGLCVVALVLRAVTGPAQKPAEPAHTTPATTTSPCPPRSLGDRGVCVPAPEPLAPAAR